MPRFQFERESRTAHSEVFIILVEENEVGRADIHYGPDVANATLCVPDEFSESDIQELIGEIDDRVVMTAQPFREDFIATVWLGRQAGVYSEDFEAGEEEEEEEEGEAEESDELE
jgi:hypothetical protein